jgi:GT2 family glycosyltransferase
MKIDSQTIELSIIIPAYRAWDTLPRCLDSLEQQRGVSFEAIVVVSGTDGTESSLRRQFPSVLILAFPDRKAPGVARNIGASQARGGILLFMDADCVLAPDGVRRTLETHRRHGHPLIGGAIGQDESSSHAAWGQYFSSLTAWMPRREQTPVPVADVATGCCSIKRWAFERFGPFSEDRFCEDTLLSWRIAQAGFLPLFDPGLQVHHQGLESLAHLLSRKFRSGRAYARLRAREQRWPAARRWLHIAAAPLVPGLMLCRSGRDVWRAGHYRCWFLRALPATLACLVAWAAGEAVGLLSASVSEHPSCQDA